MPKNSEAIRLAEASDWKGLQRLIEMAPEYAHEVGDYGMLPIHWACTESHVPAALLAQLLAAFPDGAKIKNDAELLPLHIAIRARVEPEWLEQLVDVYPNAVHVDAPEGVSVMELADQVGLHSDGVKILQRAVEDSLPENDDRRGHYSAAGGRPERDEDWQAPRKQPLLSKVAPLVDGLPANFGRGSNSNNNTPVSPAESLRSISSDGDGELEPQHRAMGRLISPTSSSSSTGSANTAPIPRTTPPLPSRLNASVRKHSLDYLAHAAAAAAAARQHQEMMQRRPVDASTQPQRSMSMVSGRHQSLPMIPNFEHVKLAYPHLHDQYDDQSSEEDEGNNLTYHHSAGGLPRAALGDGVRAFESPPEWKRDDECSICRASFGMFKHRHHCRNCGKSICSQHSADKKIMMESKGFTTPQRVCVTCYAMITHKQSKEATVQPSPLDGLLQGAKITGPVAAFHQQIQQQQYAPHPHPQVQSARRTSATAFMGISSPGSAGQRSARSSMTVPTMHSSPGASGSMSSNGARDAASEQRVMQAQMNELRHIVASQQKHIEQLTQTNMQMQQQILEQEELKAETMLLITQLMTRVSVLEMNRHDDEDPEEDDDADGPYTDDDVEADESLRRHLSG